MDEQWLPAAQPPIGKEQTVYDTFDGGETFVERQGLPPQSEDMLVLAADEDGSLWPFVAAWSWDDQRWWFTAFEEGIGTHYNDYAGLTVRWWRPVPAEPKEAA